MDTILRQHEENFPVRDTALVRVLLADNNSEYRELTLNNGTMLYRQGQNTDDVYVILSGRVDLFEEESGLPRRLIQLGPGICVGDRDGNIRSSTAITNGNTRLLAFSQNVLDDISAGSPEVRDYLEVLKLMWDWPKVGFITQYLDMADKKLCVTQLYSLKDGRSFIATHTIEESESQRVGTVRLEQKKSVTERRVETPDGTLSVSLDADDFICEISADSNTRELSLLIERAIYGRPLLSYEELELTETGSLKEDHKDFVCTCFRVGRSEVLNAIKAGATDLDAIRQRTGAGLSCGSCVATLCEMLGEVSFLLVVITRIEKPTKDVFRLFLGIPDQSPLPKALPGQHVILRTMLSGQTIERPYTLSGAAGGSWEVTIKNKSEKNRSGPQERSEWFIEDDKSGSLEASFSAWLVQTADVGTILEASQPQGNYIWRAGPAPAICLVGGIGITPALTFARTLLSEGLPNRLVIDWSTRFPEDSALLGELSTATVPNLSLVTRYTSTDPRLKAPDVADYARRFPSAVWFLCGPEGFMKDVSGWLTKVGIPNDRVHVENFGESRSVGRIDPQGLIGIIG